MKSFNYVALDRAGSRTQGVLPAASEGEARSQLERSGLFVEFVTEMQTPAPQPAPAATISTASTMAAKFEPEALHHLYRQIAAMMQAGVPLVSALGTISAAAYSARVRSALEEMRDAANSGKPLSSVMETRRDIFPSLHVSLLKAAERGGFVDRALAQLADYMRLEIEVRSRWKWQTFYPKVLLVVALTIIVLTNVIVTAISNKTGGPALLMTNILLNPYVGLPLLGLAVVLFLFLRSARVSHGAARMRDSIALWIPYYGSTAQMYAIAKFSRAFALLFAGGVNPREAAILSADACGNIIVAEQVKPLAERLSEGGSIWDALRASGMFTPEALDMIRAGETSGSMQSLLDHLALHYEDEAKLRMHKFTTVLTVCVLILVLLIVASTIFGFWLGYMGEIRNLSG